MTIATVEKKVDAMRLELSGMRTELAVLTALVNERLPSPIAPVEAPLWAANFDRPLIESGLSVQAKDLSRVSVVWADRGMVVALQTVPGDNNVFGSGDMERCDLALTQELTDGYEGREAWWHHEVLFPNDFQQPTWHRYAIAGFHHTGLTGQGNMTLGFERGVLDTDTGRFGFQCYGGAQDQGRYGAVITTVPVVRNRWYAFDYHVRWAADSSGFFDAWVDGKRVLAYQGPTLYAGQGCYLKLANYHTPVCDPYPACIGTHSASAVLHAAVRRGATWRSVVLGALEGVS